MTDDTLYPVMDHIYPFSQIGMAADKADAIAIYRQNGIKADCLLSRHRNNMAIFGVEAFWIPLCPPIPRGHKGHYPRRAPAKVLLSRDPG